MSRFAGIIAAGFMSLLAINLFLSYPKSPPSSTITSPTPFLQQISPQISATSKPAISKIPDRKLTFSIPDNWQTVSDKLNQIQVSFDSSRYNVSTGNQSVDLSGIWVGTQGKDLKRLGWNRNIYLASYSGGSRHQELYKILGVTSPSSKEWKHPDYFSEREYSYNSWSCLAINGVDISQYPVSWIYCPISSTQALVVALDTYNWPEIEQQLSAIRLLK